MKRNCYFTLTKSRILSYCRNTLFLLLIIPAVLLISCSSSKNVIQWNVELKESEIPITDRCNANVKLSSVKSIDQPTLIPATEENDARVKVYGIPCRENEDPPVYEIPVNRVKRVTYVSDPLMPPVNVEVNDLAIIEGCCRTRDGFWFFDKFEIKADIGLRGGKDHVTYPGTPPTIYNSKFIGFDRGGSTMYLGLDIIGSWNARFLDKSGRLQMGIITGLWPMDGSLFVPAGFNMRYTLNPKPSKFSDNCNSWYLYGNVGLPLDFNTEAPLFSKSLDFQRYFYGIGIGYDWAICCSTDLSIDLGFRGMNLPLPPFTCCPTAPDEKNPFRNSKSLLLRVGLTF